MDHQQIAGQRLVNAFNRREDLMSLFGNASEAFNAGYSNTLCGYIGAGAMMAEQLSQQGICRFTGASSILRDSFSFIEEVNIAMGTGNSRKANELVGTLVGALSGVLKLDPPAISYSRDGDQQKPSQTPEPVLVKVVGMPPRKTTSVVERNMAGEIVSAMQVEKDV